MIAIESPLGTSSTLDQSSENPVQFPLNMRPKNYSWNQSLVVVNPPIGTERASQVPLPQNKILGGFARSVRFPVQGPWISLDRLFYDATVPIVPISNSTASDIHIIQQSLIRCKGP